MLEMDGSPDTSSVSIDLTVSVAEDHHRLLTTIWNVPEAP